MNLYCFHIFYISNNSRKKEETQPKQKQHPVVDMTGDGCKVQRCKRYIAWEPGMLGL